MRCTIVVLLSALLTLSLVGCGDDAAKKKAEEQKRIEELKRVEALRAKREKEKELKLKRLKEEQEKAAKLAAEKKAAAEREAKRLAEEKAKKEAAERLKKKQEEEKKRLAEEKKNKLMTEVVPFVLQGKFSKAVELIEKNGLAETLSDELDILKEASTVSKKYKEYFKKNVGKKIKLRIRNRLCSVTVKKVKRSSFLYIIKSGGISMGRSMKYRDVSSKDKQRIIDAIEDNDDGKFLFYAVQAVKKRKWDKALELFDNINLFHDQIADGINALKEKYTSSKSTSRSSGMTNKKSTIKTKVFLDSAHLILDPTVRKNRKRRQMYWSDKKERLNWWVKIKNKTGADLKDYTCTFVLISVDLQNKKRYSIMLKKEFKFSLANRKEFVSEKEELSHSYNKSAWFTNGFRYYACFVYVTSPDGKVISTKVSSPKFKKIIPFMIKLAENDCFTAKGQKLKSRTPTEVRPN